MPLATKQNFTLHCARMLSLSAVIAFSAVAHASPFATTLVTTTGYPATPATTGSSIGPTDDPRAVLGKPTTFYIDKHTDFPNEVTFATSVAAGPFNTDPFGNAVIVTVNSSQSIVVAFDSDVTDDLDNPFGIDFLVFGNAFFLGNGQETFGPDTDMATYTLSNGNVASDPLTVSVSPDQVNWYTYDTGPFADSLFPTQAFAWDRSAGSWGQELDFTKPVDPSLTAADFDGLSVADVIDLYDGSAGGTGFDLGPSGFTHIRFIKVTGAGGEIDAFADVSPVPEPATAMVLLTMITPFAIQRGRRTRRP